MESVGHYRAFLRLLWRASRLWTIAALFCALLAAVLPNLLMVATGWMVGSLPGAVRDGFESSSGHRAIWALVLFGAASVGFSVAQAASQISDARLAARYVPVIEDALAGASLGPDRIDHLEDPDIARRFAAATEASRENVHLSAPGSFTGTIRMRLTGIVAGCLLLAFHWWAPFVIVAGLVTLNWAFGKWRSTAFEELLQTTGTDRRRAEYLRGLAVESPAAKELRIFGLHGWLIERYAQVWRQAMEPVWRNRRKSSVPLFIAVAALLGTNGLVLAVMGYQAYHGTVSVGRLAVFVQAVGGMETLGIIGDILWMTARGARTAAYVEGLARDLQPATEPRGEHGAPGTGPAAVRLRGVRFSYGSRDVPTLDGLDLQIPAGQSIAIVGENGAGKSTLIKLLCGLYEPQCGQVSIDGLDLAGVDLAAVRRRVAVIFQDFIRYELPLRDNVGFGNVAAAVDQEALGRAVRDAGASALAERVGWDTVLSAAYENGTDVSGGQWQRVALARALMALEGGAGVLILDEPTAALDVRAEAELFERFLQVTRGATTILVSHRLSSVRHAERIVVLAGGRIVEDGTHAQLMAAGGRSAHMFTLQAQRFQAAEPDA